MEGGIGDKGFILNKDSFNPFFNLKKSWIVVKEISSCSVYWDLFSILVVMGPKNNSGKGGQTHCLPPSGPRLPTSKMTSQLSCCMESQLVLMACRMVKWWNKTRASALAQASMSNGLVLEGESLTRSFSSTSTWTPTSKGGTTHCPGTSHPGAVYQDDWFH
jgi:hypothetical protein